MSRLWSPLLPCGVGVDPGFATIRRFAMSNVDFYAIERIGMKYLTIGQMSALNQVSVQTLRYYDKLGLLVPQYVDKKNHYRYYDISQCANLDSIQYLKNMGLHLTQIKQQTERGDIELALETLRQQSEGIEKQIKELGEMNLLIETCITNYEKYIKFVNLPENRRIIRQQLPARRIFYYAATYSDNSIPSFELNLRKFKKLAALKKIKMISLCNFGTIMRRESFEANCFAPYKTCLFINEQIEIEDQVETLPPGDFLCLYFDDYRQEKESREVLLKYLHNSRYRITGDYIFEVVADLPVFSHGEKKSIFRSQVPVES
jgi:DNA-binding transcriptional MerR regulator